MIQFFAPDIETTGSLPEVESGHCCRVLRKRTGDIIIVVDGRGGRFECEITEAHPKATRVRILSRCILPAHEGPNVVLGVAPTKNIDRIEWLIEKAVEIGIDKICLVRCERSERKDINPSRLTKIAVSAMKQSLKATLPPVEIMTLDDFLRLPLDGSRFIGYCSEGYPKADFSKSYAGGSDAVILIGPEGDFTPAEVEKAVGAGFMPVTFGSNRLRTETAALYGVQGVHVLSRAAATDDNY